MSFDKAIVFVLSHEGGYSNDQNDPGGETNFGISKRAYPDEDIRGMTRERAIQLYRRDYWDACKCDELPPQLALMTFDIAVNQGPSVARQLLQEAVVVRVDGVLGTATLQAAAKQDMKQSLSRLTSLRCDRYGKTKNVTLYGKGWFRRAISCLMTALEPM